MRGCIIRYFLHMLRTVKRTKRVLGIRRSVWYLGAPVRGPSDPRRVRGVSDPRRVQMAIH
jgi:hypothetical protein